jgi:hypothetical protein
MSGVQGSLVRSYLLAATALIVAQPCFAQAPNSSELVRTALANYQNREMQAKDYEYLERHTLVQREIRDKSIKTYEILVVDGHQLRRELRDDRPLTPQEEEEERAKNLANASKKADSYIGRPDIGYSIVWHGGAPHLSLEKLNDLFSLHFEKNETLDGRSTYVLEGKPREQPSDEIECDMRTFKLKIWIDQADTQIMRVKAVAIHPGVLGYAYHVKASPQSNPRLDPDPKQVEKFYHDTPERYAEGTTIVMDWRKINDEAWLPTRVHAKGTHLEPVYLTPLEARQNPSEWAEPFDEDTVFYNYQKFNVTHRLLLPEAH